MGHLGGLPLRSSAFHNTQLTQLSHIQRPRRLTPSSAFCLHSGGCSGRCSCRSRPSCKPQCNSSSSNSSTSSSLAQRCIHQHALFSKRSDLSAGKKRTKLEATGSADSPADPKEMPNLVMRMLAAICYMVPWLDVIGMGREVWRRLLNLVILLWIPGPLKGWYYSSQFTPLIVFFMLFLAVVKNTALPHFVRFHCMQAVMLDIVVMLFVILQPYFPAEVRWSPFMNFYDIISFNTCMPAIIYCIFWALCGRYAELPWVSDSVYMQVEASEQMP